MKNKAAPNGPKYPKSVAAWLKWLQMHLENIFHIFPVTRPVQKLFYKDPSIARHHILNSFGHASCPVVAAIVAFKKETDYMLLSNSMKCEDVDVFQV